MSDSNNTGESDRPAPATSYTMMIIILIFIGISCIGNSLLLVCLGLQKVKGHSYIFTISLIASDLFFTVVALVPPTMNYGARKNLMGDGVCYAQAYFIVMALGTCMWHVAFTCLNHFVLVSQQEFFSKYKSHCAMAMQIFFCYAMPILLVLPGLRDTGVHYSDKRLGCLFEEESNISVIVLDTIIFLILPGFITIASLIMAFNFVKKQRNRWVAVNQSINQSINQSASQPVSQPASQPVSQSASQPVNQPVSQSVS